MSEPMRTAIVTGAGSGIGRAVALRLARDGFRMIAVDRSAEGLEETCRLVEPFGPVQPVVCDVTAPNAPEIIMAAATIDGSPPTALVNNAGMGNARAATDTSDADLDRYMDVNFRSLFRLSRAFVAVEADTPRAIINIASVFGTVGFPNTAPYSAAKAAVIGLTRQMTADYAPRGVRVNAIAPGLIATPATAERIETNDRFRRLTLGQIPLGRAGTPDDVAGAVSFLCSPDAAYVSGAVIVVDGGWTSTRFTAVGG